MAFQAFRWGNDSLRGPNSSPIRQDEWDQHRELLKHLYLEADMTLEAVMEYMRVYHDFTPSYVHQAKPPIGPALVFPTSCSFKVLSNKLTKNRKHQCTLKLASWGYYKNQSRGRPQSRMPLPSPADTVPPFVEDHKLSTLEETPLSSNEKPHPAADGGGSPIEQSSDEEIESPTSDSTEETEEHDFCLDDTSGPKLPEQSTFSSTYDSGDRPSNITSNRFSLSTISELDKDGLSSLLFALDSDPDMLHETPSDETALFHDWNSLHLLETRSPVATVFDQSSKATHQNHHFANASTPLDALPVSAGSKAVSEPSPPVLAPSLFLEKRNVPPALLRTNVSIRPIGLLLPSDLNQIENLARLFSASGASNVAFRIHHIVLHHVLASLGKNQITPQLFRLAINLTKNATTKAHFGVVSDLIKKTILKRCDFLSPTTLEACVLHSYLGNSFRRRKDIRAAYKHCRLALEIYQSIPQGMRKNGSEIVLATHFDMVLEAKVTHTAGIDLEKLLTTFREESGAEYAFEREHGPMLERLADWCKTVLTDSDFLAVVEESPEELWEKAPTAKDFEQLEATILFWCFCLKYWREEQEKDNSPPSKTSRVPLAHLEQQLGSFPIMTATSGVQNNYSSATHRTWPCKLSRHPQPLSMTSSLHIPQRSEPSAAASQPSPSKPRCKIISARSPNLMSFSTCLSMLSEIKASDQDSLPSPFRRLPSYPLRCLYQQLCCPRLAHPGTASRPWRHRRRTRTRYRRPTWLILLLRQRQDYGCRRVVRVIGEGSV
jgi:hypothetical protein